MALACNPRSILNTGLKSIMLTVAHRSQGFYLGLVSVILSSSGMIYKCICADIEPKWRGSY